MQHDTMQAPIGQKIKYEYTAIDYVIFVAMILICLWSWIFVEPDTLQRSAAAQGIVKVVTSVIPWVAALESYGPQAHQLLLVHSVCYVVIFPLAAIYTKKFDLSKKVDLDKIFIAILLAALLFLLFITPYLNLGKTFAGIAGRYGYGLILNFWVMPIAAFITVFASLLFLMIIVILLREMFRLLGEKHD